MADPQERLMQALDAEQACIQQTFCDFGKKLGEIHLLDQDLGYWTARISGPESQQARDASRHLAVAELCAVSGLYIQAFSSLRLFLELSFAAVHFSVNELDRRRWVSNNYDFSWGGALDADSGLLSPVFVREFSRVLVKDARDFAARASRAYRECSEFVHGKSAVTRNLPLSIEYSKDALEAWCRTSRDAGEAVLFLFLIRYGEEFFFLRDHGLRDSIQSRFGNLTAVQTLLDGAE